MATLKELKKRVLSLRGKEVKIAVQALQDNRKAAVDLVAVQLAQGIKSDGTKSDFSYAPFTTASKKGKSGLAAVTTHLTNYNTGASYRGLYFRVEGSQIVEGTTTDKEEAISDRMDGKAFGLDKDSREEFIHQHVQKTFNYKIRTFLKL
jgi:hypothetical protein